MRARELQGAGGVGGWGCVIRSNAGRRVPRPVSGFFFARDIAGRSAASSV